MSSKPVLYVPEANMPAGYPIHMEHVPQTDVNATRWIFSPGDGSPIEVGVPWIDYPYRQPGVYNATLRVIGTEVATGVAYNKLSAPVTITATGELTPPSDNTFLFVGAAVILGVAAIAYYAKKHP